MSMWHRLLLLLHIRDQFDWAPPALGPEVNHPYKAHASLRCCEACGGGRKNPIHQKPWNERRTLEVMGLAASSPGPFYWGERADPARPFFRDMGR